jgi:predicted O-methyltransferase YrrM
MDTAGAMLSTIVLNWNRVLLLQQCVESYLATVSGGFELIIVDNASSDGSRDYLRCLEAYQPITVIYLPENIGGEAFNAALPLTRGGLIHLSENDQIYLPGWADHARTAFIKFTDLGALSLFADTPTDAEAWEAKPSRLRFSQGKILYEAPENIGTSAILRAALCHERGITISNIAGIRLKLPDDGKLSRDVRAAGFWCAFSDRYYVRNVGHEPAEFERDPRYYVENYANKPKVGVNGWQARIERHRKQPKVARASLALPERPALPEKTRQAVNGQPARLWSMFDGFTAEVEVLDLLMTLTRLVKPMHVIETGTWLGLSSCAIARGLVANGFGRLTTLEIDPDVHRTARETIAHYGFEAIVNAQLISSMAFNPDQIYDMAVFDSDIALRVHEFRRFRPWLRSGALIVFHDTAPHHQAVIEGVRTLIAEDALVGVNLPTPRGVFIGRAGSGNSL